MHPSQSNPILSFYSLRKRTAELQASLAATEEKLRVATGRLGDVQAKEAGLEARIEVLSEALGSAEGVAQDMKDKALEAELARKDLAMQLVSEGVAGWVGLCVLFCSVLPIVSLIFLLPDASRGNRCRDSLTKLHLFKNPHEMRHCPSSPLPLPSTGKGHGAASN